MESFQKHPHWNDVEKVLKVLQKEKFIAWLAGGCVRDALLGVPPKDFDVVTNATPDTVELLFPKSIAVGKQFGVIVVPGEATQIEVATFRSDGDYKDGRRPTSVVYSTPEEDAQRRDFTVNALFYDPLKKELLDFVGGEKDLSLKVLRAVGAPEKRFEEDRLRILRGIRFVAQLGFGLEPRTKKAILEQAHHISAVSKERVTEEFEKLLAGAFLNLGLRELSQTRILDTIAPRTPAHFWNEKYLGPGFSVLGRLSRWTLWTLPLTDVDDKEFSGHFRFSNEFGRNHKELRGLLQGAPQFYGRSLSQKRRWVGALCAPEALEILGHLAGVGEFDGSALAEIQKVRSQFPSLPAPLLTGQDFIKLGVKAGPKLGEWLEKAYEAQLSQEFLERTSAEAWLRKQTLTST